MLHITVTDIIFSFQFFPGCAQNYHKRCVVKVPNNCSYVLLDDKRKKSTTLQVPLASSGGSNSSLASANSTQNEESSLVRLSNFLSSVNILKETKSQ